MEEDPRSRYTDYSCVTPLEHLTNDLETILKLWSKERMSAGQSDLAFERAHSIQFAPFGEVRIELYWPIESAMESVDSEEKLRHGSVDRASFLSSSTSDHSNASVRWGVDRFGSSAKAMCEWFGLARCLALFLPRSFGIVSSFIGPSSTPSSEDRARVRASS